MSHADWAELLKIVGAAVLGWLARHFGLGASGSVKRTS